MAGKQNSEKEGIYSDWNQHFSFMNIFNFLSIQSRRLQEEQNVVGWSDKLESIYIHCYPILTKDEREKIENKFNEIRTLKNKLHRNVTTMQGKHHGEIYNQLFETECLLRAYVNEHLPFLREQPEFNLSDF